MTSATIEQIPKTTADSVEKSTESVKRLTRTGIEAMANSEHAAIDGLQQLAEAYQGVAAKNAEKLIKSIHAFAAVKTPTEFIELQRRLITESIDATLSDCSHIAKLTTNMFSATFGQMKKPMEMMRGISAR